MWQRSTCKSGKNYLGSFVVWHPVLSGVLIVCSGKDVIENARIIG